LIQNSVGFLFFPRLSLFLRRDFDDFEARLRLGVRQFRVLLATLNFHFCLSSDKKTKRLWEKREEKERAQNNNRTS
jgi:hypothetical protein